MVTGRVLQFDPARGYGFVAADDGGEDVFLHASVFNGDADVLVPGLKVEFQVMAGDRGPKAFAVHSVAKPDAAKPPAYHAASLPAGSSDEPMCDVLSPDELSKQLTELLLNTVPELAAQHVLQIRQSVLEWAKRHGWVDG